MTCRQKEHLYLLVIILKNLINCKGDIINLEGFEIGLCTSTRWSLGTWQLLLMFHLDCVNRLPEQTQRRVYGCATPAQRRGGSTKFFLLGGEPQQKSRTPRLQCTYSVIRIDKHLFLRRSPFLL